MISMWAKRRQCRSSLCLNPIPRSPPSGSAMQKSSTTPFAFGQQKGCSICVSFCTRRSGVEGAAFPQAVALSTLRCIGVLNRHSRSLGNDPSTTEDQICRGQRAFCSNRGQRGGCGRTFAFFLAEVLPRHTLAAWLVKLLAGVSLKAAVETVRLPFALETIYRLRRKLKQGLNSVRARLCRRQAPP